MEALKGEYFAWRRGFFEVSNRSRKRSGLEILQERRHHIEVPSEREHLEILVSRHHEVQQSMPLSKQYLYQDCAELTVLLRKKRVC